MDKKEINFKLANRIGYGHCPVRDVHYTPSNTAYIIQNRQIVTWNPLENPSQAEQFLRGILVTANRDGSWSATTCKPGDVPVTAKTRIEAGLLKYLSLPV